MRLGAQVRFPSPLHVLLDYQAQYDQGFGASLESWFFDIHGIGATFGRSLSDKLRGQGATVDVVGCADRNVREREVFAGLKDLQQ